MQYKRVTITLPEDVLHSLNDAAESGYLTRSAYIREAIILKIQLEMAIKNEASNDGSFGNIVQAMNRQIISGRNLRKMKPLNWTEAQD